MGKMDDIGWFNSQLFPNQIQPPSDEFSVATHSARRRPCRSKMSCKASTGVVSDWYGDFPESVWAQGSSNSGGLYLIFSSSHLLIFSSSHFLIIFTYLHPHIFTSSHLHIFSSHLHIFSSSHLFIFTSSHLLIFTSAHLHIFTSSHLLIFTSSHPHIFTSSHPHLHIFSSCLLALLPSHLHIFSSCPLALSFFSISLLKAGACRGSADETARNATLSHEMRFDRQKLR